LSAVDADDHDAPGMLATLKRIAESPLGEIPDRCAMSVVRRILAEDDADALDVAAFQSSI
jgi:FXSXX-COOH protein